MLSIARDRLVSVLGTVPGLPSGNIFMTWADPEVTPPMLVWDMTDIDPVEDVANQGTIIAGAVVVLQVWSRSDSEAFKITDAVQDTLTKARMVQARTNVFTVNEEFTPRLPNLPEGLIRVISTYRVNFLS